ncbi:MAG TPA: fructosamine kinase family protein [Allosphingosinicella sp.]|nr:fructosamine kinase family protein [Allosphingosinicella sp.]
MSAFAARVAALTGVAEERLEPLAVESVSEVLLVRRDEGQLSVAKRSPAVAAEAAMLRALAAAEVPAPAVQAELDQVLLLEFIENDGVFSAKAWADVGVGVRRLHARTGDAYGWPVDYPIGTVTLHNKETRDWPLFWGEQRLVGTASVLDRPWRERVDRAASRLADLLPAEPPAALLHGDLWTGNILVREGALVGLVDPACYYGHAEVDLAMLDLFGSPPPELREAYGPPEGGWRERWPAYQLFPALAHVRLWGPSWFKMVDRLLSELGA